MEFYESRQYCKAIMCSTQAQMDTDPENRECIKAFVCRSKCDAYRFHKWLKDNGYVIVKQSPSL